MSPTPVFAATWSPAVRRLLMVLLSTTAVLFLAGTAMAAVDTPRPAVAQVFASGVWDAEDLPDVAVVVAGVDPADARVEQAALPALRQLSGVVDVETWLATSGRLAVEVTLAPDAPVGAPDRIERTLRAVLPDAAISLGGRVPADRDLLESVNRGLVVGIAPVVVLVGALVAAAFGLRVGLAVGLNLALSTVLGGLIGARLAGDFDGTLGSTAVPAVLVALLVATVFSFRLLDWFRSSPPDDPALAIEGAVRHLLPEAALLFGGVVGASLLLDLVDPGRTPAAVVAAGGIVAALVTLGGLPAVFSAMGDLGPRDEYRLIGSFVPDGRDVPVAALAGFTCFLLGFGLFALRAPSSDLLDAQALGSGRAAARVAEQLAVDGDATSGIVASIDASTDPADLGTWMAQVGELEGVASVAALDTDATGVAHTVIALSVPSRSAEAQTLVEAMRELATIVDVDVDLEGVPVAAESTSSAGAAVLWPLVVLLAVAGGAAVFLLLGDAVLAAFAGVLRLVGTAALLGVYHLVASGVTAVELQIAALVLSVGVGLFEIGFLRRIRRDLAAVPTEPGDEAREVIVSEAFRVEGRAAMIGLGVATLGGIGLVSGELDVARRLGVAISSGLVLELFIGTWLLRPAVLGERVVLLGSRRTSVAAEEDPLLELERTVPAQEANRSVEVALSPSPSAPSSPGAGSGVFEELERLRGADRSVLPIEVESLAVDEVVPAETGPAVHAESGSDLEDATRPTSADLRPLPAADDDWVSVEDLFGELEAAGVLSSSGDRPRPAAERSRPLDGEGAGAGATEHPDHALPTDLSDHEGSDTPVPDDLPVPAGPENEDFAFGTGAPHPMRRSTDVPATVSSEAGAPAEVVPAEPRPLRPAARLLRTADRMLRRRRTDGPAPRPILDLDAAGEQRDVTVDTPTPKGSSTPAAKPEIDPEWGRIVSGLLRAEFDFQAHPDQADLETVFVDGTPLFGELREHNLRLRTAGLWVRGKAPRLERLTVVNEGSPATVAVTVLHPSRQLLDRDGRELGVRVAERREGLLWLVQDPSGRYRIAEAVDLGVVTPIEPDLDPAARQLAETESPETSPSSSRTR